MKLPQLSLRDLFWLGMLAGAVGGAASLLTVANTTVCLLEGKPAHPTLIGNVLVGAYGGVIGSVWGAIVGFVYCPNELTLSPSSQAGRLATLLVSAAFISAALALFAIPFTAPIPLEFD